MKIAIVGSGAMGMLFASYLSESTNDEIYLIGRDKQRMSLIKNEGLFVTTKDNKKTKYNVFATTDSKSVGEVDIFILIVKATDSKTALEEHKSLIGKNTILMTLQNGAGHESLLRQYAKEENIAIGTTKDGASISKGNEIVHSGRALTTFSMINKDNKRLEYLEELFNKHGFETKIAEDIKYLIWHKLLMNASSSVVSGSLQMPQGYCVDNEHAWEITKRLISEAIDVAEADGVIFDKEKEINSIKQHLIDGRMGLVSLYADLRDQRLTEVDTISGSVVKKAHELGVSAPTHELMVLLVHSIEGKKHFK